MCHPGAAAVPKSEADGLRAERAWPSEPGKGSRPARLRLRPLIPALFGGPAALGPRPVFAETLPLAKGPLRRPDKGLDSGRVLASRAGLDPAGRIHCCGTDGADGLGDIVWGEAAG